MLKCTTCDNYKKVPRSQLSLELIKFKYYEEKITFNSVPSVSSFGTTIKTYRNYPMIITDRIKTSEYYLRHLIVGQERIMLEKILKNADVKTLNILVSPVNWCSGLYNFKTSELCLRNICTLIYFLNPKFIILYDNDKNLLKRKLNKFLKVNNFRFEFMIPLKNIIKHGATWHPWYLQQVQALKQLLGR